MPWYFCRVAIFGIQCFVTVYLRQCISLQRGEDRTWHPGFEPLSGTPVYLVLMFWSWKQCVTQRDSTVLLPYLSCNRFDSFSFFSASSMTQPSNPAGISARLRTDAAGWQQLKRGDIIYIYIYIFNDLLRHSPLNIHNYFFRWISVINTRWKATGEGGQQLSQTNNN